nr:CHAT domain-containing protein [Planctomycetota bacterium]
MKAPRRRLRWIARIALIAALVLPGAAPAHADEHAEAMTIAKAASAALAAIRDSDAKALAGVATADDPDAWLVAHELCERDQYEAALALARAGDGKRNAGLEVYIESRRGVRADASARAALPDVRAALSKGDWQAVEQSVKPLGDGVDSVPRIALRHALGRALAASRDEAATPILASAAHAAEKLGWKARAAAGYHDAGLSAYRRSDYTTAMPYFESSLAAHQAIGDDAGRAELSWRLGLSLRRMGKYEPAMQRFAAATEHFERLEDVEGQAKTLRAIGVVHEENGRFAVALDHYERALAMVDGLEDSPERMRALGSVGIGRYTLGDYRGAKAIFERVLRAREAQKNGSQISRALGNLAVALQSLGDGRRALTHLRRALKIRRALAEPSSEATILINMGYAHAQMGEYLEAMRCYEQAEAIYKGIEEPRGEAIVLGNHGDLLGSLGDFERARGFQKRALALWQKLGDPTGEADALFELGAIDADDNKLEAALEMTGKALKLADETNYLDGKARILRGIGLIHLMRRDRDKALGHLDLARAAYELLGDKKGEAGVLAAMGQVHDELGDRAKGIELLERAEKAAWRLRATSLHVRTLGALARARLRAGDAKLALAAATSALRNLEDLLGGLAEEEGASARARHLDVLSAGVLATARLDDPEEMVRFLESGRASLLLESLDGRGALRWDDLDESLRNDEADAKAAVARARHEYGLAREGTDRSVRRVAAEKLKQAQAGLLEVAARIQREAKREADLFYPRAATLDEIQGQLGDETALVMYAMALDETVALVLTKDAARIVPLGDAKPLIATCTALDAGHAKSECTADLDTLRKKLVTPLNLPKGIRTVLISPEGALCYLPFGALFTEHAVALTPNGTTHVSLSEPVDSGTKVLALGDPEYGTKVDPGAKELYQRGAKLGPLPASREEAKQVAGQKGDVRLLGPDASEAALREALAKEARWRAVHLACHGLVNADRPTLSSLALTRSGEDDGFLTCLEVLRTRIPADLVVLSACDTGKGRNWKNEGIVGLTRTFMYAGSKRVICSLWKVNDAATKELMVKFYELWRGTDGKPGLGA